MMRARCMVIGDVSDGALSSLGDCRRDSRVERRIIGLRLISSGLGTVAAAKAIGVSDRTLRLWVESFNRDGVSSLTYDRYHGGKRYLSDDEEEELAEAIRKGPPAELRIGVWRGRALGEWIKDRFGVEYSESGVYFLLHRLGFSSLMPRPVHPESNPAVQEEFKKNTSSHGQQNGARPSRRCRGGVVPG